MVDIEKLRSLANEAIADECWEPQLGLTSSETAFAKEASPGAVLELIAELKWFRAEALHITAENMKLRAEVERLTGIVGNQVARKFVCQNDQREVDELVALGIEQDKREIERLRAEVEALRRDAERWRKAREILTVEAIETAHSDFVNFGLPPDEKENVRADGAIDAAMAAKEEV